MKKTTVTNSQASAKSVETKPSFLAGGVSYHGTLTQKRWLQIYFFFIRDLFSKWYETVPLQNQEAKIVAKSVVDCWFSRFGCPANLPKFDRGANFLSNLFKIM